MHDSQIEDRLRTALRAEGDALPLTITPDELERRLTLRRRERTSRRMSLVAAAVGVVAIGSLLAGLAGWFRPSDVGGPLESATPAPTVGPSNTPAGEGLPCVTIDPSDGDQPPALILGATPGDAIAYGGAVGAYRLGDRHDGVEGGWVSLDPTAVTPIPAGPPTERLQAIASNPDACLTGLVADAVPFGQVDAPALAVADIAIAPTRFIEFGMPPDGDWLLRVHAEFATTGAEAWTETFYRVVVRTAAASAGTLPSVLPNLETPPGTTLVDFVNEAVAPYAPTGDTGETNAGEVPPRGQYRVDIVCLGFAPLRWSIGIEGQLDFLVASDQVCDGTPGRRTVELGLPTTNLPVIVGTDAGTAWHIRVSAIGGNPAFIPPALRMIETGNTEGSAGAAEAFGRCISTPEESDQCAGEWFVLDGARSILIPPSSRLTFGLEDGWRIEQARITAAVTDQVRGNSFAPEYSVAFVEDGGPLITVPVDLGRGSWIVRVSLNASRGDETFGAYYDLPLVIGE